MNWAYGFYQANRIIWHSDLTKDIYCPLRKRIYTQEYYTIYLLLKHKKTKYTLIRKRLYRLFQITLITIYSSVLTLRLYSKSMAEKVTITKTKTPDLMLLS